MDKIAKLKAGITIGIETKEKIERLKKRIDGEERPDDNISKLIYGNSWYIALDEEEYEIDTAVNSDLDKNGIELDTYNSTLEEKRKREISKEVIEKITEPITAYEKQKAIRLQQTIEEKENKGVAI